MLPPVSALFALPQRAADLLRHYTLSDEDLQNIGARRRPRNKAGLRAAAVRAPANPGRLPWLRASSCRWPSWVSSAAFSGAPRRVSSSSGSAAKRKRRDAEAVIAEALSAPGRAGPPRSRRTFCGRTGEKRRLELALAAPGRRPRSW